MGVKLNEDVNTFNISIARSSDIFHVLPTENVPFVFRLDLWMTADPNLVSVMEIHDFFNGIKADIITR